MNQKIDTYKKLKFWQTSRKVSLQIVRLIKNLPNEKAAWAVSDQVLRSSFSVGANIAEGFGRYKGKEYPRFLQIALGSARETEYWLELLGEIHPKFLKEIERILSINSETIKMLVTTLKSLKSRKR